MAFTTSFRIVGQSVSLSRIRPAIVSPPMTPFEGDGVWLRCALHAHTTNSDGELAPDMLVRHYEWAGFDVLAITDHWVRTVERSTRKLLVIPSTELNAQAGGPEHDVARPRPRRGGRSGHPGGRVRPAAGRRRLDRRERRRPLHRAHLLERAPNRPVGGLRGARRHRGLERGLRARDRARRRVAPLGRGARARPQPVRARDRRLAPSRLRQRLRVDDGARGGASRRRPCSPRCAAGSFYGSTGPEITSVELGGRRRHRALQPGRERDARLGQGARRARERRPPRLPERFRDPRARLGRPDHRLPAREAVEHAVRPARGRRRRRQHAPGRTPCGSRSCASNSSASREFDLLVVGGGIVGAGIAEAATRARPRRSRSSTRATSRARRRARRRS